MALISTTQRFALDAANYQLKANHALLGGDKTELTDAARASIQTMINAGSSDLHIALTLGVLVTDAAAVRYTGSELDAQVVNKLTQESINASQVTKFGVYTYESEA